MEKNRINLKELSELLNKELANGNGDAYLFIGEYYLTKDNWQEDYIENGEKKIKSLEVPYSIYTDEIVKEKVMALNYLHVNKLTDEENEELEKSKKEKKSTLKKKSIYASFNTTFNTTTNNRRYTRYDDTDQDDVAEAPRVRETETAEPGITYADYLTENIEVADQANGVDGMFEYLSYLRDTVLRNYPTLALAFVRRIEDLENRLNNNNVETIRQESEIIADEMDAIIATNRTPAHRVTDNHVVEAERQAEELYREVRDRNVDGEEDRLDEATWMY